MLRTDFNHRKIVIVCMSVIFLYGIYQFFWTQQSLNSLSSEDDRTKLEFGAFSIDSQSSSEGQVCKVPALDLYAPEILNVLKSVPPINCGDGVDWVETKGSTAKITDWAKKKYGKVECVYADVLRKDDFNQHYGVSSSSVAEYSFKASDVALVECSAGDEMWSKTLSGIRHNKDIFNRTGWDKVPSQSLGLNLLMFGFDSMSHNMWKRKLPKTYRYATLDLNGIALNGYNIVGDGTPQALIPILTGKTELELPDTRKRMKNAQFVNVYPFIWNDFRNNGYATAWGEDMADVGTFTYRLKGFQEQPVDHYLRPFYNEILSELDMYKDYCYGSMPRHRLLIEFVKNMYEVYKDRPKFVFSFHGELSHDNNNRIANADEDVANWLREFNAKGYLNNTLLILMSDHGSRYADIRNSLQGKQEERLPAFIFVLPPWFEKKYPDAVENLKLNVDRLTTPFDIYPTLKNILFYEGSGEGNVKDRSISLFKKIPLERSCHDASIEPHWCTCLDWEDLSVADDIVVKAVQFFIRYINGYTERYRKMCAELSLGSVLWAAKLLPNKDLLKFKQNADIDGFVGDMSGNTTITVETVQIKVRLVPGDMIFEASLQYRLENNMFSIKESDISRINKYKDMTKCLNENVIHLRKYCYCFK